MEHFTATDFEEKILNKIEFTQGYTALYFLTREIPDIFDAYLQCLRDELSTSEFYKHPALKALIDYTLSLYFDLDKLNTSSYVYREIHQYAQELLGKFSKRELLCITYCIEGATSKNIRDIERECLVQDGRFNIKFPPCLSKYFIASDALVELLEHSCTNVSRYKTITDWVESTLGYGLMLSEERLKDIVNQFILGENYDDYGLLDELYQVTNTYSPSSYDRMVSDNEIYATKLLKVVIDLLNEMGYEEAIKFPCKELISEEDSVERQNHNAISLLRIVIDQTNDHLKRKKDVEPKEYPGYLNEAFLSGMADYIIMNSHIDHEESLIDGVYDAVLLTVIVDKLELGDYSGPALKITPRFIGTVFREFKCIDFMTKDGLFDVQWEDREGEPSNWAEYIAIRCERKLDGSNTLKDNLETQDYYRLVLAFGEDALESDSFLALCNEYKDKLFIVEHIKYEKLKEGAITLLRAHYTS